MEKFMVVLAVLASWFLFDPNAAVRHIDRSLAALGVNISANSITYSAPQRLRPLLGRDSIIHHRP